METRDTNDQKKEIFFEKYQYLQPLLDHYDISYDKQGITMDDYLVYLNRIVLKYSKGSLPEKIDNISNFFSTIIKGSVRLNMDSILFKALSYFIPKGFDYFISSLKTEETITPLKVSKELFSILNEEKIAKFFNLDKMEVEKELAKVTLKKVGKKKKFNFKQKIGSYIFLFYRDLIEQDDKEIKDELFKFIKEKDWNDFYKLYKELKKYDDFDRELSYIFDEKSSEKNEIKNEIKIEIEENNQNSKEKNMSILKANILGKDVLENPEDSQSTEANSGTIGQKSIETNNGASEEKSTEINNNYKNKSDMKKIEILNNEQLSEKYNELSLKFSQFMELFLKQNNKIDIMQKRIDELSAKLDLSILINNLSTQRDSYKKTLEIILKYLNEKLNLNLILIGDDIWKKTKIVIDKISDCAITEKNRKNLINALQGLLFCKDYANTLTHGKSIVSEELNKYYKDTNEVQIIATASYENMKNATKMFFTDKVNEGEFKIINGFLLQKVEKWKSNKEIDYSKYISENKIRFEILLEHFGNAENIVEKCKLYEDIDNSLLNN